MINQHKWVNSLPKTNNKFDEQINQLDNNKWINTISKKKNYDSINSINSIKKYSLTAILFVCGLLLVSAVKNETRNIQKEINNLTASIDLLKFDLDQAILDNEVITSPENISKLANEYLDNDFIFYKKSQIKNINNKTEIVAMVNTKVNKEKNKSFSTLKMQVKNTIEKKRTEIQKLQEIYHQPKTIPEKIKKNVAKKIEEKKLELKNLYSNPRETITLKKVQKWAGVQIVKVFFGMPVIPGK